MSYLIETIRILKFRRRQLICVMCAITLLSCSSYRLTTVPESSPHGTLVIARNSTDIHVEIDEIGEGVWPRPEANETTIYLSPGLHLISAEYRAVSTYEGVSRVAYTKPITNLVLTCIINSYMISSWAGGKNYAQRLSHSKVL